MIAGYSPEGWGDFFLAAAVATAALSGLIFVGLSVSIRTVLGTEKRGGQNFLTGRALEALYEWTIDRIAVRLRWAAEFTAIERDIEIDGPLDGEQRARLLQIAEKCPVHKILTGGVAIRSELAPA